MSIGRGELHEHLFLGMAFPRAPPVARMASSWPGGMFSISSAIILEIKLVEATIRVKTPARGPNPKILTKKMAIMISWKVLDRIIIVRATR